MSGALKFSNDAMVSIQSSLTFRKPLVLYLRDPNLTNADDWIEEMIFNNKTLSNETIQLLETSFIRLQIDKDSNDFKNLVSIMPGFQNTSAPCIFFIFSGQIIDFIPKQLQANLFDSKIKEIFQSIQKFTGNNIHQQNSQEDISNNMTGSRSTVQNSTQEHQFQTSGTSGEIASNSKQKSLKEESADIAAQKYREQVLKQQRQAKLDRERILNLLKLDRKEQMTKEKDKIVEPIESQHPNEIIRNSKLINSQTYIIQIKMIDGKTIRHKFKNTDTLSTVREFLLSEYPDYNSFPFYFFKNIDRITFGEADELMTLLELNLNMSTLIIKPLEKFEDLNITTAQNQNNSSFSWLKSKMASLLFPNQESNSMRLSNDAQMPPTNDDIQSSNSSMFNDESDTDSVYHTPLLTSTNPRLRPNLSSFNLYGSQGLISSSNLNPSNENGQHSTIPSTPLASNQQEKSYFLKKDDLDVSNGNSISLQFPEDDK